MLRAAGHSLGEIAERIGTTKPTVAKWAKRFERGEPMEDRSSRPRRMPRLTPPEVVQMVLEARKRMGLGPAMLSGYIGIAASTIWKILKRDGKSRLPRQPREAVVRYERERPGELVHIDIKKLPRIGSVPGHRKTGNRTTTGNRATKGTGYDYVQVCIDDRTRVTHAVFIENETSDECIRAFTKSVEWFAANGIEIERVLSDNGAGYKRRWNEACNALGIKPKKTRPYRPQTNGKAERLIQTLLREWAYGPTYHGNAARRAALPEYLDHYNTRRYHTSCKSTPWQRAASDLATVNNVRGHYS
jgi:transposase InsO family protein